MHEPACRACGTPLRHTFADLGSTPLANRYLSPADMHRMEPWYPLHARVCEACKLVQLEAFESPEAIFGDYAYLSSFSDSWLAHCRRHAGNCIARLGLGPTSSVVEVASNDGYLLQYFRDAGVPVLGIEPARNVAAVARGRGIPTEAHFFGVDLASRLHEHRGPADLMLANNVLAHVPDLHDFVGGFARLLAPRGVITFEFPHLLELMRHAQFDTIYHEHFSYLSLLAVEPLLARHGLAVFDVDRLPTHGGSLRLWVAHAPAVAAGVHPEQRALERLRQDERAAGLDRLDPYLAFGPSVERIRRALLRFLLEAREAGRRVVAYGAAAKGNTLLNVCGVRGDLVSHVVDRSPHKQGRCLPGSRIPVVAPEEVERLRPDYLLILPWNLREEIAGQMASIRDWGGRFAVAVPELEVF